MRRLAFTAWLMALCSAGRLAAEEAASGEGKAPSGEDADEPPTGRPNMVTSTLGGRQFWGDELFFHDWHIQRNTFTGHYRLLDGQDRRHAWGTFEECRARLQEIRREQSLPPMHGTGVIVLHGLMRSQASMVQMVRALRASGEYTVFNVTYPTTRGPVDAHAHGLARIIANLDGIETIHFVAHSLGNLVIRHYLADATDVATGKQPDPRLGRIVMLGPPNNGAWIAETIGRNGIFDLVVGASGTQLARGWQTLAGRLATPACPFGIIAGGRNAQRGYNPLVPGDNDLIVSVETTRLAGAADFAVVPVIHTLLMDDPTVQRYTLQFLKSGCFIDEAHRQPIELVVNSAAKSEETKP